MDNVLDHDELNVARQLLFHYGRPGGYAPGDFHFRLIQAFEKADMKNTQRLFEAFPEFRRPVKVLKEYGSSQLLEVVRRSHKHHYGEDVR